MPLVPHAVPGPQVAGQSSAEGLVGPPKRLVPGVQITKSAGSTLVLEGTQELKGARVKGIFRENAIQGDV